MSDTPADSVVIFTDGSCLGNPGPGGWAVILRYKEHEKEMAGGEPDTTNNRMELTAALRALETLKRPCRIDLYTDSEYVRRGVMEWMRSWKARGWKTADRKPVANRDLWEQMDEALIRHDVRFHWVKGHDGHPENERVDVLAREQAMTFSPKRHPPV